MTGIFVWDKQPATPKTFVDKSGRSAVSGIIGNGYMTTFHAKLGNTATGKAISKDFPIDKPFLTFKIGGGRLPKEACLNLLIDGKIVRTETGFDSPDLRPVYWDVYAFIGKTAHLEIVDTTASQQRSYIMVDDLCLSSRPPVQYSDLKIVSGYGDGADKVLRLIYRTIPENVKLSTIDSVSMGLNEYLAILDNVSLAVIRPELDYRPKYSIPVLAKRIKSAVDTVADRAGIANRKELVERLYAHGISDWVRTHIYYDKRLLAISNPRQSQLMKDTHEPATLLCFEKPGTTCSGFALLIRAIASEPCFS